MENEINIIGGDTYDADKIEKDGETYRFEDITIDSRADIPDRTLSNIFQSVVWFQEMGGDFTNGCSIYKEGNTYYLYSDYDQGKVGGSVELEKV